MAPRWVEIRNMTIYIMIQYIYLIRASVDLPYTHNHVMCIIYTAERV